MVQLIKDCIIDENNPKAKALLDATKGIENKDYHSIWKPGMDMMFEITDRNRDLQSIGFKWMVNQGIDADFDQVVSYLNKNRIKGIILERKNALRQAISYYHLEESIKHHSKEHIFDKSKEARENYFENESLPEIKPEYFFDYFERHAIETAVLHRLRSELNDVLYVNYEDFSEHPTRQLEQVEKFIGASINVTVLDLGLQKIHSGSVGSLLRNWPTVKKTLLESEWGNLVQEWDN